MPTLPNSLTYGTIEGRIVLAVADTPADPDLDPDAQAAVGSVTFTPSARSIIVSEQRTIVAPAPITKTLDAEGYFTVNLVATVNSGMNPNNWTYNVTFNLSGVALAPFSISVPPGTTQDISTLVPVPASNGTFYIVGPAGPAGPPGSGGGSGGSSDWNTLTNKPSTFPPSAHTHPVADLSNATAIAKSVLIQVDAPSIRSVIGAGTSSLILGTSSTTAKPGDWTPTSANISDASTIGKAVLTASTAAAARATLGAGTSNLAVGTASTDAKAGDYQPASTNISDSTAIGRSILVAADAAAVRTIIGAGTGGTTVTVANISDATAIGRTILLSADAATVRANIGAGISNLAIGTTSITAKAGDYQPTAANISDASTIGRNILKAADQAAVRSLIGDLTNVIVRKTGDGVYPARGTSDTAYVVLWFSATEPVNAITGTDIWMQTV